MNSIDADFGKSIKGCGEKFSLDALDARQQDGTGLVRGGVKSSHSTMTQHLFHAHHHEPLSMTLPTPSANVGWDSHRVIFGQEQTHKHGRRKATQHNPQYRYLICSRPDVKGLQGCRTHGSCISVYLHCLCSLSVVVRSDCKAGRVQWLESRWAH